ncbi:hypothetical protein AB0J63_30460 [Streptosporangium canum]
MTPRHAIDAGVRVVAGSGGRLTAGSATLLDTLPADVNAHLTGTWPAPR